MRKTKLKYVMFLLALICQLNLFVQRVSFELPKDTADTWQVSLITCGPGVEVYNQFGHSAIRMRNDKLGIDAIYNYGIFNFDTPNFSLKFTLGETDYQLGIQGYRDFVEWYAYCNRDVWEQVINLMLDEKNTLIDLLNENYKPQKRVYRYNFFYDNCATRPRDLIEKCLQGRLQYTEDMNALDTGKTFRSVVHEFTANNAWSQFGIDLLLGSEADKPISKRATMFIPSYLKDYFETASIAPQGKALVLQLNQPVVIPTAAKERHDTPLTPFRCTLFLFIVTTILTIYGIRKRKSFWKFDLVLFLSAGIAGCSLAFVSLFSEHPAVSPNYLLLLFQPLHLLLLPWFIRKVKKQERSLYLVVLTIELVLFIFIWAVIPQKFPLAVLPLALCLLVRSASNWLLSQPHKI